MLSADQRKQFVNNMLFGPAALAALILLMIPLANVLAEVAFGGAVTAVPGQIGGHGHFTHISLKAWSRLSALSFLSTYCFIAALLSGIVWILGNTMFRRQYQSLPALRWACSVLFLCDIALFGVYALPMFIMIVTKLWKLV